MDAVETNQSEQLAIAIFREHGGMLMTGQALQFGIHPRTLYSMRDSGVLERISRGVYRLADLPPLSDPDLVSVATRIPDGVICLISALAFHRLTREIPHYVYLALPRGDRPPRLSHPPLRVFWLTESVFRAGVETHTLDGVSLRIYSPAKTIADCFKYRNKIGIGVAVEALRMLKERGELDPDEILHFARICRVENVMKPYLQALT
ncbi:MAG: type IV toxin-antitoxin system AbiEi family antitoxin domain-containing protein [Armatimonadetes bacterium]|nr:type IV toxin-antitoxin system AbiEi family antitoxin domain-containing protein [Armatimonadota bacterium]